MKTRIVYNPLLSIKDNAEQNKVSVATIRKYISDNNIDRKFDSMKVKMMKVKEMQKSNPSLTPIEIHKKLGYSINTIKKYMSIDESSLEIKNGKLSSFDLSKTDNLIKSVSNNQDEILKGIIKLYNDNLPFDCDLTYSKGNFYKKITPPLHRFDKYPLSNDVLPLDEAYKLHANLYKSIVVDLPFIIHNNNTIIKMCDRFNNFTSPSELFKTNDDMIELSYHLLKKKGIFVIKTMDVGWNGKQYWVSNYVLNKAEELGFKHIDTFILTARTKVVFNVGSKQHCARKWHSYFFVFRK